MESRISVAILCGWTLVVQGLVHAQESKVPAKPGGVAPASPDEFRVGKGQFTFDAEGMEGGPWHSRRPQVPSDTSGLTIGRGYDMQEKKPEKVRADLIRAGMPEATAKLYAKAAGLEGEVAREFIADNDLPELTPAQQKSLFEATYAEKDQDMRRLANKADVVEAYGRVNWDRLDPAIYEMLVDLHYRGDYGPEQRKKIQRFVVANDLKGFSKALSDQDFWKDVPRDRLQRRLQSVDSALKARSTRERLIGDAKVSQKGLSKKVKDDAQERARRALQEEELRRARDDARRAEEERKRFEAELKKGAR